MRTKAIITTVVLGLGLLAAPALAQQSGGGLGGVLDTLGGLLGGGSRAARDGRGER